LLRVGEVAQEGDGAAVVAAGGEVVGALSGEGSAGGLDVGCGEARFRGRKKVHLRLFGRKRFEVAGTAGRGFDQADPDVFGGVCGALLGVQRRNDARRPTWCGAERQIAQFGEAA
jgi:hypothetical protein